MPYPLYEGKHELPSATEPSTFYEEDPAVPDSVVLCFQPNVYEYARETYPGRRADPEHPRYSLYAFDPGGDERAGAGDDERVDVGGAGRGDAEGDGRVGAAGDLGIGGPAAARVVEELLARGVETLAIVGHAGGLQRSIDVGDVVVAERALRDEGTSYHYLEPTRAVEAAPNPTERLAETARESGETVHVGTTWTTDAIFRETVPELERYADEGVLTTDMEAATVFSVAAYREVDALAAFVVSDYVGPEEWDDRVDETWPHLRRLFDLAVEVLAD